MWTWWLGAQTHNLKLRISFRFTSNSDQISTSDSIQFTIISNSNHNHSKFKSQSCQIQFRFQITFTSNSILIQRTSQFSINFISSLRCTQGQNLLAGECALLSQGQIGVLVHLSNFTHVQIWYFRFICRR